jgi:hypothetical protein
MNDLGAMRLVDLVGENSILGLLNKGIIEPTEMYKALDELMGDFKPGVTILDVLADLFSGEENNRPQVCRPRSTLQASSHHHPERMKMISRAYENDQPEFLPTTCRPPCRPPCDHCRPHVSPSPL